SRVRALNHEGRYYRVRGPLNSARSPQGYPVLFSAGQSEEGMELAARHADCVLAVAGSMQEGREVAKRYRDRMDKYDRSPDSLKMFPGIYVCVGRTQAEAEELWDEVNSFVSLELRISQLSKGVRFDLSGYPVDGPLPDMPSNPEAEM